VQERLFFVFHVFAEPSREIEKIVHHQDLRLGRIDEPIEEIAEYFSLLSMLVSEFVCALLSPGVGVAQGADQDHVLEVDVMTELLEEISTTVAQLPRQELFAGLDPQREIPDFRNHDLDELVIIENPLPDFTRPHPDLQSANTDVLNATCVPSRKTRDLVVGGSRHGALRCSGSFQGEAGWVRLAVAYGRGKYATAFGAFLYERKIWRGGLGQRTQESRRVDMKFRISYDDDMDLAEILTDRPKALADPEPMVRLHVLDETSIEFIVRPWVATANCWEVYWDVTREVEKRFDAAGISIPVPHRDIRVRHDQQIEGANDTTGSPELWDGLRAAC
jgi:hypothetical protein